MSGLLLLRRSLALQPACDRAFPPAGASPAATQVGRGKRAGFRTQNQKQLGSGQPAQGSHVGGGQGGGLQLGGRFDGGAHGEGPLVCPGLLPLSLTTTVKTDPSLCNFHYR